MRFSPVRLGDMTVTKFPISALPLPPSTHILTRNLTPDPLIPSVPKFFEVLSSDPSIQRRARLVDSSTHFSHLTPLTIPFPYRIEPPADEEIHDKAEFVERWLSSFEALEEMPLAPAPNQGLLKKYSSSKRETKREILALSDTGLRDCLPHLAVGDAFAQIGPATLAHSDEEIPLRPVSGEVKAIRQELIDVLSGHSVLMSVEEGAETPYAPWSLRYSGHQFGTWAGQLGDGRAISILATPHPEHPGLSYELQLKGAGRTPYSRTADGLAVLRSSIREYLCAEAMHALKIPTTRSLALVHLPDLEVFREEVETASIVTRMAPSFIRIGSFEALNPPQNMFFFGGGQQEANYEALRILGEWVSKRVLRLGLDNEQPWGKAMVMDVARRNAKMVAAWQAYGFMHGVINTDNVSIMGLTIDYGPYAFMDIFNSMHICNHSDEEGRYAYKYQPTMILYALRALLSSLAELIGAEAETGKAVSKGWAEGVSKDKLGEWRKKGMELEPGMKAELETVHEKEYYNLMRKRLGLKTEDATDPDKIIHPLLSILGRHNLDYPSTLRRLSLFHPVDALDETRSSDLDAFVAELSKAGFPIDQAEATKDWKVWLVTYAKRIESEKDAWTGGEEGRQKAMRGANPRFVLRQWLLEEIIKKVQTDPHSGKRALAKVHEMAVKPFEPWGAENDTKQDSELTEEEIEERRYCGLGSKNFIGFQCSCSS